MRALSPRRLAVALVTVALDALLLVLLARREFALAAVVAIVPPAALVAGWLVASDRSVVLFGALALGMVGGSWNGPLPLGGSVKLYPSDLLAAVAAAGWIGARLVARERRPRPAGRKLLWIAVGLLAVALAQAIYRGHERYGVSLVATPARLALYAAIVAAVVDVPPRKAYRGVVAVFYAGAFVLAGQAVRLLATGGSQTGSLELSTGGIRILALSSALYLSGSLLLALLNLDLPRSTGERLLHVAVAAVSLFGVVVAFGRTTYYAVGLLVPLLLIVMRRIRRAFVATLPIWLPALVLVALLVPRAAPQLGPTLVDRLTARPTSDLNVRWRERANEAILEQVRESPLVGVGFGRGASFRLDGIPYRIDQDPHNSFLYLLAGGGIVTLGAFLLVLLAAVAAALRRLRVAAGSDRVLVVWSLTTGFCFLVNASSVPLLSTPSTLLTTWIVLALPLVVASESPARRAAQRDPVASPALVLRSR